jgi:hypothetical protein
MEKINSLQDYITKVEMVCKDWDLLVGTTTHPWFRGQADFSWDLLPKLYRGSWNKGFEREMFRDFKLRATAFVKNIPSSDMEWLFIMQHYGMPTRLLDWTESHLLALYFAVNNPELHSDAAVWILNPWSLNLAVTNQRTIPTGTDPLFEKYILPLKVDRYARKVEAEQPVAVRPVQNTPRIIAQKGTFTIFGHAEVPLNKINIGLSKSLYQIQFKELIIEGSAKQQILKALILAGITESVLFPDLDGLSNEISFRYSKAYLGDIKID